LFAGNGVWKGVTMKLSTDRTSVWLLIVTSLLALVASPVQSLAQATTTVSITPQSLRLEINETATIDVTVEQVSNLYSAELHLTFDPDALEIIDARSDQQGIQIQTGIVPFPDLVVLNQVDNRAGTIDYTVTQLPPSRPGEGDGVIASLTIRAKKVTLTEIQIHQLKLFDLDGESIHATSAHGQIRIVNSVLWVPFAVGGVLLLGLGADFVSAALRKKRAQLRERLERPHKEGYHSP
jgi:hypothetical protein